MNDQNPTIQVSLHDDFIPGATPEILVQYKHLVSQNLARLGYYNTTFTSSPGKLFTATDGNITVAEGFEIQDALERAADAACNA